MSDSKAPAGFSEYLRELGRKGGKARLKKMTAEQRSEVAKLAAARSAEVRRKKAARKATAKKAKKGF